MKRLSQRIGDLEVRITFAPSAKRAQLDAFVKRLWEQRQRETANLPRKACVWLPQNDGEGE